KNPPRLVYVLVAHDHAQRQVGCALHERARLSTRNGERLRGVLPARQRHLDVTLQAVLPEFMNWRSRLAAAGGLVTKVVRATRKSSREEEKQKFSHEQQLADMETAWGPVENVWVWSES